MVTYEIRGELTVQTVAGHMDTLLAQLDTDGPLRVSLADVAELDTAGLQLLLLVRREADRRGRELSFAAPSDPVRRILTLTHLTSQLRRGVDVAAGTDVAPVESP